MEEPVCTLAKNSREAYHFRLGEFRGHRFADLRLFAIEDGKPAQPTKRGVSVSPQLWPQFKQALAQLEAAMIEAGWLDLADLQE